MDNRTTLLLKGLQSILSSPVLRQVESAYYAGAPLGVAGAINAAADFRNMSDMRIAALRERLVE